MKALKLLGWFFVGILISAVFMSRWAHAAQGDNIVFGNDGRAYYQFRNNTPTLLYPELQAAETAVANGVQVVSAQTPIVFGASAGANAAVTVEGSFARTIGTDLLASNAARLLKGGIQQAIIGAAVDYAINQAKIGWDASLQSFYSISTNQTIAATATVTTQPATAVWTAHSTQYGSATLACSQGNTAPFGTTFSGFTNCANGRVNCNCQWSDGSVSGNILLVSVCSSGTYNNDASGTSAGTCKVTTYSCSAGYTLSGSTCSPNVTTTKTPIAEAQADAAIQGAISDPKSFLDNLQTQGPIQSDSPLPITPQVPQQVTSPKTVTQNPDGTRTETQTVVNNTISGDKVYYNINNVTNTYNNTTNQQISSTSTPATGNPTADQPQPTFTDSSLPPVPHFYTEKYPNGLTGLWNTFKVNLNQTQFIGLIYQLTPNWSGGECPSWSMSFNIGRYMNFGTDSITVPCIVWTIVKSVVIVTALFVARGLIFGG